MFSTNVHIVVEDLPRAFYRLFYLQFCDSSDQRKNTVQQRFYQQFERYFYMKIILTILPAYLVTNLFLSFFLSFLTDQKHESGFQQVESLVTRNISVFCLQRVALYFKTMPNLINFYKGIFFTCYSYSYHSYMHKLTAKL